MQIFGERSEVRTEVAAEERGVIGFLTLGVLGVLGVNPFCGGRDSRKGRKGRKG